MRVHLLSPTKRLGVLFSILLFVSLPLAARVNVVTLPDRASVQLTIYNSVDLTLVKETRRLTFRKGLNRLEFSWANTLIDPTSVEFRPLNHSDAVEVIDVRFPPRVSNTLEWRIQSEVAGEVEVEIRYFTSGIRWSADYVAEASPSEKRMDFAGHVRVTNLSGEDYENAQIRLVVGVIRLVEDIARLARNERDEDKRKSMTETLALKKDLRQDLYFGLGGGIATGAMAAEKKEIVKENLSEYFLYTVEGRDTIPNGWSKRLPSFLARDVPLLSYYKFEKEQWGDQPIRFYKFQNDTPSHLGKEPLPDGDVKAFRFISADKLYSFIGRAAARYIPINESVELQMGPDPEVMVKPSMTNWEKADLRFDSNGNVSGWTVKETWQFDVQNSRDIDVMLDIRRTFSGDWTLESAAAHEKVDARKIKFIVPLKPHEKRAFAYQTTTRFGTNATR